MLRKLNYRKLTLLLVVIVTISAAGYSILKSRSDPIKSSKEVTRKFLNAMYESNPTVARSVSSANLQTMQSDEELSVAEEDKQIINNITFNRATMVNDKTIAVEGTMKSTQPQHSLGENDPSIEEISNTFTIQLIEENKQWKVNSFEIE